MRWAHDDMGTPIEETAKEISVRAVKKLKVNQDRSEFITWICRECAIEMQGVTTYGHISTHHQNICSVCREEKSVTSPRNWNMY